MTPSVQLYNSREPRMNARPIVICEDWRESEEYVQKKTKLNVNNQEENWEAKIKSMGLMEAILREIITYLIFRQKEFKSSQCLSQYKNNLLELNCKNDSFWNP